MPFSRQTSATTKRVTRATHPYLWLQGVVNEMIRGGAPVAQIIGSSVHRVYGAKETRRLFRLDIKMQDVFPDAQALI